MRPTAQAGAAAVLRAPQVSWVLVASLVGRLPLGAAPLALLMFARETMTIGMAGMLAGAYTAGLAAGQPLLARIADRWRQPPVIWGSVAVSTAGFALAATRPAPAVVVMAAAAAGVGTPPFEACLRVLWTDMVGERLRHAAYTLDITAQELIFVAGPIFAVAAASAAGAAGGLIAIAVAQVAGVAAFTVAPVARRWRGAPARRHWAGALRSASLWPLLVATVLVGVGVGGTVVAITGYAEAEGSRAWAGWLLAGQAAGALVRGRGAARRPASGDPRRWLPRAALLLAAGYAPMLLVSPLPVMAVWVVASGLMLPAMLTAVFVTADRVAPPGTAAEAFAWVATAFLLGSAAGSALDGALLEAGGRLAAGFLVAPLAILAASAVLGLAARRSARRAGERGRVVGGAG